MQKNLATPCGGWERSISLSSFIILSTPIIFIHPAGKCPGQHLLSREERVSEITKCFQPISCTFIFKKKWPWTEDCRQVSCQLHPVQYSPNKALRQDTHSCITNPDFSPFWMPKFYTFIDNQHNQHQKNKICRNVRKRVIKQYFKFATY